MGAHVRKLYLHLCGFIWIDLELFTLLLVGMCALVLGILFT